MSFLGLHWLNANFSLYSVTEVITECLLWCGKPKQQAVKYLGLIFVGWGFGVVGREQRLLFLLLCICPVDLKEEFLISARNAGLLQG